MFRVPRKEVKHLVNKSEQMLAYCEVDLLELHTAAEVQQRRVRPLDFFRRRVRLRQKHRGKYKADREAPAQAVSRRYAFTD